MSRSGKKEKQPQGWCSEPESFLWEDVEQMITDPDNSIGTGKFSRLYTGMRNHSRVAIKIYEDTPTNRIHYKAEKEALHRFIHPNIIKLHGYSDGDKKMALVLQYMPKSLSDVLKELDWQTILKVLRQTAAALQCIHKERFVLVDLKPENILINEHNEIRLIDFGSIQREGYYTESFTKEYVAPEVHSRMKGSPSTKADVFSLGVVMLQLIMKEECPCSTEKKDLKAIEKSKKGKGKKHESSIQDEVRIHQIAHLRTAYVVQKICSKHGRTEEVAEQITTLAKECTNENPRDRPTATQVIEKLEAFKETA